MKPTAEVSRRIEEVGTSLAQALGEGVLCIAVYGSAAGDEFAPGHSDVNLVIVLREVTFADLRLIGSVLGREASDDLVFATPLVIAPTFLKDARDSFPIELDDMRARHRILHGEDLLSGIVVKREELREEAEREVRSGLLRLRSLVLHRPPEEQMRHALAAIASTVELVERALLREQRRADELRGETLFAEIRRRQGIALRALPRLHALREGTEPWPSGDAFDELVAAALSDVEALVAWVDTHAQKPLPSE